MSRIACPLCGSSKMVKVGVLLDYELKHESTVYRCSDCSQRHIITKTLNKRKRHS